MAAPKKKPANREKTGIFYRSCPVEKRSINEEARTVEVVFSTEFPVQRWFGQEILDHKRGSVRMDWITSGRAPFLGDHSSSKRYGVVESAKLAEREGRAVVRFGNSALAREIFQDYLDGIRSSVSVGYVIHEAVLESMGDDGEVWRITDWEPLEISDAAVPADPTAHARAGEATREVHTLFRRTSGDDGEESMKVKVRRRLDGRTIEIDETEFDATIHERIGDPVRVEDPPTETDEQRTARIRKEERERADGILKLATRWNQRAKAEEFIREGKSLAEFRGWLLDEGIPKGKPLDTPGSQIGLNDREARGYSLLRAIRASTDNDWSGAEFERECHETVVKRTGGSARPRGFKVPYEVLRVRRPLSQRSIDRTVQLLLQLRDLSVGTPSAGGFLKATEHMDMDFIELLRNRMMVTNLGARVLTGLVGDISFPKQTGSASAQWITEGNNVTESNAVFGQVLMQPGTVAARQDMTRKLLLQSSPDVEDLVRDDLNMVLALALDLAAIAGSGTGAEPLGILGTSGVGLVPIGTNGGAPTWPHIVNLETEVAVDNADVGSLAYLTNARVRGKLKQTEKFATAGQPVWERGDPGDPTGGAVNGYRGAVSNQVPSNLTKGSGTNLSAIIFGNFRDLMIGEWGELEITADPYALGDSGGLVLRAFLDADVAVRHPESFAIVNDAVTT